MERDSSKHSEFSSLPQEADSSSSAEPDKKKKKKSQSETEKTWTKSDTSESKSEESKRKQPETIDAWWRRTSEVAKQSDDKEQDQTAETTDEQLTQLSRAEMKEVAETYLTARRHEIAQELSQRSGETTEQTEAQAALAADTYLAAVEHKLRSESDIDITDATNEAYDETAQTFVPEIALLPPDTAEAAPSEVDDHEIPNTPLDELPMYSRQHGPGGGDNDREPPYWQRDGLPPDGDDNEGPFFDTSGTSRSSNLETVIERDFAAERVAAVRGLLVGGIIGYLIGRRRGRIKTERRLIPIQKKLEREVAALYTTIAIKETQLRKLVSEKTQSPKALQPEHVFASTNNPYIETIPETKTHSAEIIRPPKSVGEVVDQDTLLIAAEKITVGDTTLKKVFETGLISERGLRRAVTEYGKGGDIRRILAEELLIKEIGYELDPNLRDRPLNKSAAPSSTPANQPALYEQAATELEQQVTLPTPNDTSLLPPLPAPKRTVPPLLITANITALVVLVSLIVILIITHL